MLSGASLIEDKKKELFIFDLDYPVLMLVVPLVDLFIVKIDAKRTNLKKWFDWNTSYQILSYIRSEH